MVLIEDSEFGMFGKKKKKLPKFKIVASTKAHGSLDVHICELVANNIRELGFDSKFLGYFSFEELPNGDTYILKHERRGAWKYVFTPSQGDAEGIIINKQTGEYPSKTKGQVSGHIHTSAGSIIGFKGIDIINCPAWVTWFPYARARALMHYWQPEVGGWILVITKDGRTYWQKWLYKPFVYNEIQNKITENTDPERSYVDMNSFVVSPHFQRLLDDASYVVIAIADTHTGEKNAPCPESFKYINVTRNPDLSIANRRMNAYWYHFMYMARYIFKVDEIWHLGDPVAGTNPFEKYRDPLMTNLQVEASAFTELMNAYNYDKKTLKRLVKENLEKSQ